MSDFDARVQAARTERQAERDRDEALRAAHIAAEEQRAALLERMRAEAVAIEEARMKPMRDMAAQVDAFMSQLLESNSFKSVFSGAWCEVKNSNPPLASLAFGSDGKIGRMVEWEDADFSPPAELTANLRMVQLSKDSSANPRFQVSFSCRTSDRAVAEVPRELIGHEQMGWFLGKVADALAGVVAGIQDNADAAEAEIAAMAEKAAAAASPVCR